MRLARCPGAPEWAPCRPLRLQLGGPVVLSPRMQRLAADHRALRAVYSGHPRVQVEPLGALPPSRYRITFRIPGLRLENGTPVATHHHVVEVQLPLEYPRGQPYCAALTPI